jgi:hypothetical protein
MDYEAKYHEAMADLAELRQAFKHYIQAVGDAEGVYHVDSITDQGSAPIVQLLLLEVMEENARQLESPQTDC